MMIGIWCGSWLTDLYDSIASVLIDWLTRWSNVTAHGNIQAGVPFIFVGVLAGYWLIITRKCATWWLALWVVLVCLVAMAEVDQTVRSGVDFNWGDVSWGSLDALVSMVLTGTIALLIRSRKRSA